MEPTNKQGKKVRFIKVKGRIVPIDANKYKGPSKAQKMKNYEKYGDGANQAARIDAKYAEKGFNTSKTAKAFTAVGLAGFGLGVLTKGKLSAAGFGGGAASFIAASVAAKKNQKKYDVKREKEYIKTFGTTSDGNKPFKTKKAAKNGTGF
jgi:hypothetical protein